MRRLAAFVLLLALAAAEGCGKSSNDVVVPPKVPTPVEPVEIDAHTHVVAFTFVDPEPCSHCVSTVQKALTGAPGVKKFDAEKGKRHFTVEFDPAGTNAATLAALLKDCGEGVNPKVE